MSGFPNDRRTVEQLVWPLLLTAFALEQAPNQESDEQKASLQRVIDNCMKAADEILVHHIPSKRNKLYDRAVRAGKGVTEQLWDGKDGRHVGMALYYALEALLSSGTLELEEGDPLATGMSEVLESLSEAFTIGKLDAAAQKTGRKLIAALQRAGYFAGHNRAA